MYHSSLTVVRLATSDRQALLYEKDSAPGVLCQSSAMSGTLSTTTERGLGWHTAAHQWLCGWKCN